MRIMIYEVIGAARWKASKDGEASEAMKDGPLQWSKKNSDLNPPANYLSTGSWVI